MKLNQSKFIKKNKRNVSKNNKRMLENADILNNGKSTAKRESLLRAVEWRKTIRDNITEWRGRMDAVDKHTKRI